MSEAEGKTDKGKLSLPCPAASVCGSGWLIGWLVDFKDTNTESSKST